MVEEETTQLMSDFKSAIRSQQMQMFQFEEKLVQVVNTVGLQANALSASQTSFGSPLAGPVNNLSLLEMDEDEDEVSSTASDAAGPSMEPAISSNNQLTSKWAVPPRILLVEDDAICRRLSAKLLQIFGCTYDAVNDGVAAVNKMNLDKYDLVLMVSLKCFQRDSFIDWCRILSCPIWMAFRQHNASVNLIHLHPSSQ